MPFSTHLPHAYMLFLPDRHTTNPGMQGLEWCACVPKGQALLKFCIVYVPPSIIGTLPNFKFQLIPFNAHLQATAAEALLHGISCFAGGRRLACYASNPMASAPLHSVQYPGISQCVLLFVAPRVRFLMMKHLATCTTMPFQRQEENDGQTHQARCHAAYAASHLLTERIKICWGIRDTAARSAARTLIALVQMPPARLLLLSISNIYSPVCRLPAHSGSSN